VTLDFGDILDFTANDAFIGGTHETVVTIGDDITAGNNTNIQSEENIVILTGNFFANATALFTATTQLAGLNAGNILVIYAANETFDARIAVATVDAAGDITAATDVVSLVGITIADAATGFGPGNFILD
jgi:hypothetical protein